MSVKYIQNGKEKGYIRNSGFSSYNVIPKGYISTLSNMVDTKVIEAVKDSRQELINTINTTRQSAENAIEVSNTLSSKVDAQGNKVVSIEENYGTRLDGVETSAYYGILLDNGGHATGFETGSILNRTTGEFNDFFGIRADKFYVTKSSVTVTNEMSNDQIVATLEANDIAVTDDSIAEAVGQTYNTFSSLNDTALAINWDGHQYNTYFNGRVHFQNLANGNGETIINGGLITTQEIDVANKITIGAENTNRYFGKFPKNVDDTSKSNPTVDDSGLNPGSPDYAVEESWMYNSDLYKNTTVRSGDTYSDSYDRMFVWKGTSWQKVVPEKDVDYKDGDRGSVANAITGDYGDSDNDTDLGVKGKPKGSILNSAITSLDNISTVRDGDRVFWSNTNINAPDPASGEAVYKNGSWSKDVKLIVHGDAIIDGTMSTNKLSAGVIEGCTVNISAPDDTYSTGLYIDFEQTEAIYGIYCKVSWDGVGSKPTGITSYVYDNTGNYNNAGTGIDCGGYCGIVAQGYYAGGSFSSIGDSNSYGVAAETLGGGKGDGCYAFYTENSDSYFGGSVLPFTGSHLGHISSLGVLGDVVEDIDNIIHIDINNAIGSVSVTKSSKSKSVVGVFNGEATVSNINTDENKNLIGISFNSIGEGLMNVCDQAGDIIIGDYICSSDVQGKGMKQDDDLMHNYTVAKARESIIWDDLEEYEELDGHKWTQIACTYHCG